MATLVIPDSLPQWQELLEREEVAGTIPLPAVDWIRRYEQGRLVVSLLAPDVIPEADEIFVHVEAMPREDRVALHALLSDLALHSEARPSWAVYHLGGLDYSFCGPEPERAATLKGFGSAQQPVLWGLLRAIALLGVRYPDLDASTPRQAPRR